MKYKINWSKFKGTTKLPAQKSPSRFAAMDEKDIATKSAKRILGDAPEFMGMSTTATYELAARDVAGKLAERKFIRSLMGSKSRTGTSKSLLGQSRLKTAGGLKTMKGKVSGLGIKKAKSKGAMKAYTESMTAAEQTFSKTLKKFTSKSAQSPFKMKSVKAKKSTFSNEGLKQMGLDEREVSAMVGRTYKTYRENPKYNIFRKRK